MMSIVEILEIGIYVPTVQKQIIVVNTDHINQGVRSSDGTVIVIFS